MPNPGPLRWGSRGPGLQRHAQTISLADVSDRSRRRRLVYRRRGGRHVSPSGPGTFWLAVVRGPRPTLVCAFPARGIGLHARSDVGGHGSRDVDRLRADAGANFHAAARGLRPTATPTPTAAQPPPPILRSGVWRASATNTRCGTTAVPATLAMGLSFWEWPGDQRPIADYIQAQPARTRTSCRMRLADFVNSQTDLRAPDARRRRPRAAEASDRLRLPGHRRKGIRRGTVSKAGWATMPWSPGMTTPASGFNAQDSYIGDDFPFPYRRPGQVLAELQLRLRRHLPAGTRGRALGPAGESGR